MFRLVLVNALYFKGLWETQFRKANTKPNTFFVKAGLEKQVSDSCCRFEQGLGIQNGLLKYVHVY